MTSSKISPCLALSVSVKGVKIADDFVLRHRISSAASSITMEQVEALHPDCWCLWTDTAPTLSVVANAEEGSQRIVF